MSDCMTTTTIRIIIKFEELKKFILLDLNNMNNYTYLTNYKISNDNYSYIHKDNIGCDDEYIFTININNYILETAHVNNINKILNRTEYIKHMRAAKIKSIEQL